jgi:hypothetical protein
MRDKQNSQNPRQRAPSVALRSGTSKTVALYPLNRWNVKKKKGNR